MKNIIAILSVVIATILYSFYQNKNSNSENNEQVDTSTPILRELPDFEAVDLKSGIILNKNKIKELKPRILVIHFWGTWCAPCEAEFPSIIKMASKLEGQEGVYFLFVAVKDMQKAVEKFLDKFPQIPKNVSILLNPNGEILQKFGTVKVPETYIFNGELRTQYKLVGPQDWGKPFFHEKMLKVLN